MGSVLTLKHFLISGAIVCIQSDCLAQHEPCCQNKADGPCLQLLNHRLLPTIDTATACFTRFVYCDRGQMTYPVISKSLGRLKKKYLPTYESSKDTDPVMLNDTIFYLRRNGKIRAMEIYDQGYPIVAITYRNDGSRIHVRLRYTEQCTGHPESYYFEVYNRAGVPYMQGYYRRDKKGRLGYLPDCF